MGCYYNPPAIITPWECGGIKMGKKNKKYECLKNEQSKLHRREKCNKDCSGAYKSKFQKQYTQKDAIICNGCSEDAVSYD